jgi:hypothetical protein
MIERFKVGDRVQVILKGMDPEEPEYGTVVLVSGVLGGLYVCSDTTGETHYLPHVAVHKVDDREQDG